METEKLLVLLAGQSNMAGRGIAGPDDLLPIANVEYIRKDFKWVPAVEPITRDRRFVGTFSEDGTSIKSEDPFETVLPSTGQYVCGVGPGRTFGRLLAEANPGKTVGLIPVAVGGTSIAAWQPGGVDDWDPQNFPYDFALLRAKEAQKNGKIIAILWHQGENDALKQTKNYKEQLANTVMNFRRDLELDQTVPFIAGDLASFYAPEINDHTHIVDKALDELEQEIPGFLVVHTKDLMHKGDHLHFDTPSLHELGKRYFMAYQKFAAESEQENTEDHSGENSLFP